MAYTSRVTPEAMVGNDVDESNPVDSTRLPRGPGDTGQVPVTADAPPRRVRRGRRQIFIALVVAAVVAGGAVAGIWFGTRTTTRGAPVAVSNKVVSVTTGTMQRTVSASGTIEPSQEADLNFDVSGLVTAVDVTTGQTVGVGQALATLDPSALQAQVDAAKETLAAAEAQLTADRDGGSPASQIDSDEAQSDTAQTALTSAEADLADATLTSTIAGTVASVDLNVGQEVSDGGSSEGGSSSDTSTAQVVVVATSSFMVNTAVDDTQVRQVTKGQAVDITTAGSNAIIDGTVASVALIASGESGVASFPVTVSVTGSPSGLYAGASATLSIIVQKIADAVEVPTAAISYSSGGQAAVTVVQDGRDTTRSIITGVSVGGQTQVTSGLNRGDKVLEHVVTFQGNKAGGPHSLLGGNGAGPSGRPGGVVIFKSPGPGGPGG